MIMLIKILFWFICCPNWFMHLFCIFLELGWGITEFWKQKHLLNFPWKYNFNSHNNLNNKQYFICIIM